MHSTPTTPPTHHSKHQTKPSTSYVPPSTSIPNPLLTPFPPSIQVIFCTPQSSITFSLPAPSPSPSHTPSIRDAVLSTLASREVSLPAALESDLGVGTGEGTGWEEDAKGERTYVLSDTDPKRYTWGRENIKPYWKRESAVLWRLALDSASASFPSSLLTSFRSIPSISSMFSFSFHSSNSVFLGRSDDLGSFSSSIAIATPGSARSENSTPTLTPDPNTNTNADTQTDTSTPENSNSNSGSITNAHSDTSDSNDIPAHLTPASAPALASTTLTSASSYAQTFTLAASFVITVMRHANGYRALFLQSQSPSA